MVRSLRLHVSEADTDRWSRDLERRVTSAQRQRLDLSAQAARVSQLAASIVGRRWPKAAPIKLKERLYQQNGTPRFTIIPPEWVKNIDGDPNFRALWQNAERAIRTAKTIAFVGFSFTPTDLHVEALFRVALAKPSPLKTLIIANPNREHRQRIRAVFAKPLERSCLIRQYQDLADFATSLNGATW